MLQIASYSDRGGRPVNEDYVLHTELHGGLCLALADGLGGHGSGDVASRAAAECICGGWPGGADPELLRELVLAAHEKVKSLQTGRCSMKTTAVALLLAEGRAAWAHAGDSRLYHFAGGRLKFQTTDHSVAQMGVMLGDITPDQIRFHEDRSRVLRALGQEGGLKVDAGGETLAPGRHAFLLCSDGFWEYVLEPEMEETLQGTGSPDQWLRRMRGYMRDRLPEDNDNNTAAAVWVDIAEARE